jgi:hypothetical protein
MVAILSAFANKSANDSFSSATAKLETAALEAELVERLELIELEAAVEDLGSSSPYWTTDIEDDEVDVLTSVFVSAKVSVITRRFIGMTHVLVERAVSINNTVFLNIFTIRLHF